MNEEDEKEKDMNKEDEKEKDSKNDEPIKSVFEFLKRIKNLSKNDTYIYRGEPERYESRNSSLLRDEKNIDRKNKIEQYKPKLDEYRRNVFAEISSLERKSFVAFSQHHGLSTNLIDMSTNALVALWFACQKEEKYKDKDKYKDKYKDKDGYVYMYKESKTIDITEFIEDNEKLLYKNNYNLIDMLYNPVSSSRSSNGHKYDLLIDFEENVLDKVSYDDAYMYMQTLLENSYSFKIEDLESNVYEDTSIVDLFLHVIYTIFDIKKTNTEEHLKEYIQDLKEYIQDLIKVLGCIEDIDLKYRELVEDDLNNCINHLKVKENNFNEKCILYVYKTVLKIYFSREYGYTIRPKLKGQDILFYGSVFKEEFYYEIKQFQQFKEFTKKLINILDSFNNQNTTDICLYDELKTKIYDKWDIEYINYPEEIKNSIKIKLDEFFKTYSKEDINNDEVNKFINFLIDCIEESLSENIKYRLWGIENTFRIYSLINIKTKYNLGFKDDNQINETICLMKEIFKYDKMNPPKPLDDLAEVLKKIVNDSNSKQDEAITGKLLNELNEALLKCSSIANVNYFPNLVYKPILTFKRGVNQKGLFFYQTFVNLDINNETYAITQEIEHDHRIIIPKEHKKSISEELDILGINRAFIYGDYDNIARYLEEYKYNPNK